MSVLATSPFCIKDGYQENPGPVYFLDDIHEREGDEAIVFQPDVLPRSAEVAEENGLTTIIDVGCGQATKLAAIHDEHPAWTLIGIDYGDNLAWCRERYPWGTWVESDLEQATADVAVDASQAVVVASDVIEHLVDPRQMLLTIRKTGAPFVLISTPERDLQFGPDHYGPSPNLCHVREWNRDELAAFLEQQGFKVLEMGLTRSNDQGDAENTILAICQ